MSKSIGNDGVRNATHKTAFGIGADIGHAKLGDCMWIDPGAELKQRAGPASHGIFHGHCIQVPMTVVATLNSRPRVTQAPSSRFCKKKMPPYGWRRWSATASRSSSSMQMQR